MALIITSQRPADAGKPGGGGGGPIPGVIFFGVGNDPLEGNWAMNPDGTDKQLVISASEWNQVANDVPFPSYCSYGADSKKDRWWLTVADADMIDGTVGKGNQLYAYRSGTTVNERRWVRLTNFLPGTVDVVRAARWSNDGSDSFVSFVGAEIINPVLGIIEPAIYRLPIRGADLEASLFTPGGFVPYEVTDPRVLVIPVSNQNAAAYDWSPDGTRLVCSYGDHYLHFYDTDTEFWESIPLSHNAFGPTWSPDGNTVAYSNTKIYTISADLTQQASPTLIADGGNKYMQAPVWSTMGDHLAFVQLVRRVFPNPPLYDVFRMTRTGAGKTDLTSASFNRETGESPIRWTGN